MNNDKILDLILFLKDKEYRIDNKDSKEEINKLKEEIIVLNNKNKKLENTIREKIKNDLIEKIKKTKGNLSKEKITEIIRTI